jgi:hypothetical protein
MGWMPPPDGIAMCHNGFIGTNAREASMSEISILAIDLAKGSFQVCGVKADGSVVFNKSASRARLYQLLAGQCQIKPA